VLVTIDQYENTWCAIQVSNQKYDSTRLWLVKIITNSSGASITLKGQG
jgi:hypothetical protein